MPEPSTEIGTQSPHAALPTTDVLKAAGHPERLAILRELCTGQALPVWDLARRIGTTNAQVTKLVRVLDTYDLVEHGRNVQGDAREELYWVPQRFRVRTPDGIPALDFGEVLLRFPPVVR